MRVSPKTARRLTLYKQGFHPWPTPTKTVVLDAVKRLGCIQIDTINVVARSHYLALWSRLGSYERDHLDQLLYPDRKVFEFWAHAASIIPLEHYRYFIHAMKENLEALKARAQNRLGEKAYLLDQVVKEIRRNGPMSSKDFKSDSAPKKRKNRGWWNWKPAKTALEMLYWAGILTVAYRENFQRYYDLTENVLPSSVDIAEPSDEERRGFYIEKTVDAWGIVKPRDLASYYYTWCTRTPLKGNVLRDTLKVLVNQDTLEEVTIEGDDEPYYILARDRETIQQISDGETGVSDKVTFLSPFDNLTWNKNRTKDLFSFEPKFEAYFPKEKRKFGYYALNILYGDKLVGKLDPKMHRDEGLLEVKALRLEETFKPDIEFEEKLTESFRSFMKFHKAKKIRFRRISPLLKSWEKTVTLN